MQLCRKRRSRGGWLSVLIPEPHALLTELAGGWRVADRKAPVRRIPPRKRQALGMQAEQCRIGCDARHIALAAVQVGNDCGGSIWPLGMAKIVRVCE